MSRSFFVGRLHRVLGALAPGSGHKKRRSRARRFTGLEYLEGRAFLATINASGVISSTAAGSNVNYTITLTNASSSNSGIGTFWYAWVPGEDFLATSPISVSPPPGWTDNITNMGAGDGFAIQFLANSPANDVRPGSSLNLSFESADSPASVNGNSVFFPGTPLLTPRWIEVNDGPQRLGRGGRPLPRAGRPLRARAGSGSDLGVSPREGRRIQLSGKARSPIAPGSLALGSKAQ